MVAATYRAMVRRQEERRARARRLRGYEETESGVKFVCEGCGVIAYEAFAPEDGACQACDRLAHPERDDRRV